MSKPSQGAIRDAVAPGIYILKAVIVADIGTQVAKKFGAKDEDDVEEKKQLIIVFEVVEESTKDKPVTLSAWLTNSLGKKSKLRKLYIAAGLNPGKEGVEPDDLAELQSKFVKGTIEHSESGREKIVGFAPLKKGEKAPKGFVADFKTLFLDENYNAEDFEAMPKFIQDMALKSEEFTAVDTKSKQARAKGKKK